MRLPQKDSATWRAVITAVEATVGFILALLAVPGVAEVVRDFNPEVFVLIPTIVGVLNFARNYLRKDVVNY